MGVGKPLPKWKRVLITFFILFNIAAVAFSTIKPVAKQNAIQRFFYPYLLWTRLSQSWPLFCPSPRKFAKKFRVDIMFKDGTKSSWKRPYPPNWDFFQRHLSYNYQKWDLAGNHLEESNDLREDLAKYVTRLYWNDQNPPIIIKVVKSTANWPPPSETGYVQPDVTGNWVDYVLSIHLVPQKGASL